MKLRIWLIGFCLMCCVLPSWAQLNYLTRAIPEDEGVSSKELLAFMDTVMRQKDTDMHGVMVLRNGKVIAEKYNAPFAAQYSHTLYSCSKTFTAVAVGLAVQDSLLSVTDKLVDFFPDMLPEEVNDSLSAITVEDLLTMRSGLPVDTKMRTIEKEWIRAYLANKMVTLPGKKFAYDSIDTYLLSAIVQKVTGKTIINLLKQRIFTPMGITQVAWEQSPEGISCGGWGLYLQLESMAKFGQLLLQRGKWNNEQLVSAEWIDEMVKTRVTDAGRKYGYQIWITDYPGMVRCDGAYGQFIFVIPDKQMVVAMTQCMRGNNKLEHAAVWDLSRKAGAAMPHGKDYNILKTAKYRLTPTRGKARSSKRIFPVKLKLGDNILEWTNVELDFSGTQKQNDPTLKVNVTTKSGDKFTLVCDYQKWNTNEIKGFPLNLRSFRGNFSNIKPPFYAAASYGWQNDDDLYLRLHYVNWLSSCRLRFKFNGNAVTAEILTSDTNKSKTFSATVVK